MWAVVSGGGAQPGECASGPVEKRKCEVSF